MKKFVFVGIILVMVALFVLSIAPVQAYRIVMPTPIHRPIITPYFPTATGMPPIIYH